MKKNILFALVSLLLYSCKDDTNLPDGLYAKIETNKGEIILQLDYEKAPITVANFVSLSEGKNDFVADENLRGRHFYDGLKFHRVIENFMIQGGDPLGTGSGDAGYHFKDEITDLRFDKAGILAMANSGPGTNGSQFFITHVETPWLNDKHTIFGHVVGKGMDVVNKILQDDYITKITIIRNGDAATRFNAPKIFQTYFSIELKKQKEQAAINEENEKLINEKYKAIFDSKIKYLDDLRKSATKTKTGLEYIIIQKGNGKKPAPGTPISINYAGYLENGKLFDSNIETVCKTFGIFDPNRASQNGYQPIPFEAGRKDGMITGFIEGLEKLSLGDKAVIYIPSYLGYGEAGAGEIIPPNSNIIFEIELLQK